MSELKRLRTAFERIHKVLLTKLESGDDQAVFTQLDWLEKQIAILFKLADSNLPKFRALLDPADKHKWSERDTLGNVDGAGKPQKTDLSIDFEVVYSEKDVLDTLTRMLYQIMTRALETGNLDVYAKARALLALLYRNVVLSELHKLNFAGLYTELLTRFMSIISRELGRPTNSLDHRSVLPFMAFDMHLHFLHEDDFAIGLIESQTIWLYEVAKLHIDAEYDESVEQLIKKLSEYSTGHKKPESETLKQFFAHYMAENREQEQFWKPIDTQLLVLSQGLFSKNQCDLFFRKLEGVEHYLKQNSELASDGLIEELGDLKMFAIRRFKFRQLQSLLIKVMTYAVFRKKYHLLDYAYHLSQPNDADHVTIFSGEVVLTNLGHLLGHLLERERIEEELRESWKDYHGVKTYLDQVFIKSLLYWVKWGIVKELYFPLPELVGSALVSNIPHSIKRTRGILKRRLEDLQKSMNWLEKQGQHPDLEDQIFDLDRLIGRIIEVIQN